MAATTSSKSVIAQPLGKTMPRDSNGGISGLKWFIGILVSLLAAGGRIVALLNYIHQPSPPSGPSRSPTAESKPNRDTTQTSSTVTPTPRVRKIAVYNDDTRQAMPNEIHYIPNGQSASAYLTTTALQRAELRLAEGSATRARNFIILRRLRLTTIPTIKVGAADNLESERSLR